MAIKNLGRARVITRISKIRFRVMVTVTGCRSRIGWWRSVGLANVRLRDRKGV